MAIFALLTVVIAFVAVRWFWWILDVAADDLYNLFLQDEERWWWEKKLPSAIGRSGFVTRAASKLLNENVGLRKRVVLIHGVSVYPQEGGKYPGVMLLVQLDTKSDPRKKKEKAVSIKRPAVRRIPVYSTRISLNNRGCFILPEAADRYFMLFALLYIQTSCLL